MFADARAAWEFIDKNAGNLESLRGSLRNLNADIQKGITSSQNDPGAMDPSVYSRLRIMFGLSANDYTKARDLLVNLRAQLAAWSTRWNDINTVIQTVIIPMVRRDGLSSTNSAAVVGYANVMAQVMADWARIEPADRNTINTILQNAGQVPDSLGGGDFLTKLGTYGKWFIIGIAALVLVQVSSRFGSAQE